jgi:hypothetical protein
MDWQDEIIGLVKALRPSTLLAVMPECEPLWNKLAPFAGGIDGCRMSGAELLAQGSDIECKDIAIVAGTLECMDKGQGGNLIAALRDLHSKVLYVAVYSGGSAPGLGSHWSDSELIACGLHRVRQYTLGATRLSLFHYDIYDYKLTPDWLNSKHWANPHRWDQERW